MGASLLAKRPARSTSMLTDPQLSRAGSLPQVVHAVIPPSPERRFCQNVDRGGRSTGRSLVW
ncbi:hypothetical protein DM828_16025 [Pseudomonas umsongensis]|nr:hypothetical protein [Pseudomonas umsongensis]